MLSNILTDKDLSTSEKVVLLYLIDKGNNSRLDITFKTLQEELGMTRPTIAKAIKNLEEKQIVKKENNFDFISSIEHSFNKYFNTLTIIPGNLLNILGFLRIANKTKSTPESPSYIVPSKSYKSYFI